MVYNLEIRNTLLTFEILTNLFLNQLNTFKLPISKKISYGVFLLFFANMFVINLSAQTNSDNTSNHNSASIANSSNQFLADGSIPANDIYQGNWDNNYIRIYKNLIPNKPDSALILFNGVENKFTIPFVNGKVLSQFGFRGSRVHSGVDIRQKTGDEIVSAFDGKVRLAKYSHGYGNVVVVRHYNGLETLYAHLSKIKVKVNQDVKSGELVGLAGSTGRATASHLHFETRFLGEAFNPEKIIDFENNKLRQNSFEIKPETFVIDQSAHINSFKTDSFVSESTIVNQPAHSPATHNSKANHSSKVHHKNKASVHTIKKGDTLYSLAKKNGTTVQALCKLNHITPKSKIKLGSVIKIK